ncbi:MAG: RIP metalloprotease RseP [Bryobacteraceae bacterium]
MFVWGEDILWLLVLIGVMIMIHEAGHYWAARYFNVKVEVFSFGFGPRLFGFRRGETDCRFSLILLGGYVKMAGEQFSEEQSDDPRHLMNRPRWQRLIIYFAGPFMNFVLAVGLLAGLYMVKYQRVAETDLQAVIGHVAPGSPAAKAGLEDGDRIVALDGKKNPNWEDIGLKEVESAYRPMHLIVQRKGKRIDFTVTPTLSQVTGMGYAGWDEQGQVELGGIEPGYPSEKAGLKKGDVVVSVNGMAIHSQVKFRETIAASGGKPIEIQVERKGRLETFKVQPVYATLDGPARWMIGVQPIPKLHLITTRLSFPAAVRESVEQNGKNAFIIVQFLKGMAERRMSTKTITGPIGLGQLSGEAAREGPTEFFMLMSLVSLNLAIFNLLPIPVLDGGSILMLLIEIILQRDMSLNVKEAVFKVGFVFIMVTVAFVIYNDISKMLPGG